MEVSYSYTRAIVTGNAISRIIHFPVNIKRMTTTAWATILGKTHFRIQIYDFNLMR